VAGTKPIIYLDACIFISILTGEQRPGNETAEVAGLGILIERREITPVTSTMTRVEVLECKLDDQQKEVMKRLIRPPKIQVKDAIAPIMDMAHELRDYYQSEKDSGRSKLPTIETPDAIHLATAIFYECDRFYTFDEKDVPNGSRPKRGLIPMSGVLAERYPLTICKPQVQTLGLAL
jgi:predicted nucleic acid-binding protein